MIRRRAMILVTAGALGAGFLLSGCGGSTDSADSAGAAEPAADRAQSAYADEDGAARLAESGARAGAAPEDAAQEGNTSRGSDSGGAGGSGDAVRTKPLHMIRTGQIELRVGDLPSVTVKVRAVATGLGGYVSAEETSIPPTQDGEPRPNAAASITLRVPEPRFDQALDQLARLGEVLQRTTNAEDVTAQVTDLDSRVKTQRASVDRVRALMAQAKELKDIVLLESELSRRQADLESLESQLKTLSNQAALSTVTVVLDQPGTAAEPEKEEKTGIWNALAESVQALLATLRGVLLVVVVLLPWAALAALAGLALWVWRRRFPQFWFGGSPKSGDQPAPPAGPEA